MDLPSRVGPYLIERALGAGAMGAVLLGRHPETNEAVAIKVLHERDPLLLARFAREAEAMARVHDPRVVRALDAGLHEGQPFLVLEFCPGQDLASVLKTRGALEPGEAASLAAEIGRGLAAAHASGTLHRDLKPANVMIDPAGRPKVADFGLASLSHGKLRTHSLTQSGVILGTPSYMAPEQMHDARQVDERSDVYALGAILYECLSGNRPFGTGTNLALMQRALAGEAEPLSASVPRDLAEIVQCAMALDPADRFSQASLFVEALDEFLTPPPSHADRRPALALGALALFALLGLLALALGSSPPSPSAPHAPPPGSSSPGPPSPAPPQTPSLGPSQIPSPGTEDYLRDQVTFRSCSAAQLRSAVLAGHPAAMQRLSRRLAKARGVTRDTQRAFALATRAAELGDSNAMLTLAGHYLRLSKRNRDAEAKAKGTRYLNESARLGNPEARITIAFRAADADGLDRAAAYAWKALGRGDPAAFFGLLTYVSFRGYAEQAQKLALQGVALGIPEAHSLRARLTRAHGGQGSIAVRDDYRLAAETFEPEGLCGYARWLLEQANPTREQRTLAEELLSHADLIDSNALVERTIGFWREGKTELYVAKIESLANRQPPLPGNLSGELALHAHRVFDQIPDELREDFLRSTLALLARGRPHTSLDPRVTYHFAVAIRRGWAKTEEQNAKLLDRHTAAMPYLRRAARAGHPAACYVLGTALLIGQGVEQDTGAGVASIKRAGELSYAPAWERLGDVYRDDRLVRSDVDQAIRYYLQGAKTQPENNRLRGKLSQILLHADRPQEARGWAEKAAAGGDLVGSAILGRLLIEGIGGPADPERGLRLTKALVDRNDLEGEHLRSAALASLFLSRCFTTGEGLPKDAAQAEHYKGRHLGLKLRWEKDHGE